MEWYFASLAMLFIMVGCGYLTGNLLTEWLPVEMQATTRIFLSVPLGWSLITLIATASGWLGHGYSTWWCASVTIAISAAGAWVGRKWLRRSGGDCTRLAAFCVVASFPLLAPLLRHGIFSMANDTFLYVCQAQWLQHHGFLEHASVENGYPEWGTVVLMQSTNLRMGASFLLGWTQAMFGLEWPHEIFPAVASLGLICGALGAGATLISCFPRRWQEAW